MNKNKPEKWEKAEVTIQRPGMSDYTYVFKPEKNHKDTPKAYTSLIGSYSTFVKATLIIVKIFDKNNNLVWENSYNRESITMI